MSQRGYKTARVIKIGLVCCALFLSACAMGGGTIGTGLNLGDKNSQILGTIDFNVVGTLLNANGYPMTGAKVSARTAAKMSDAISNKGGRFVLPVSMKSGEEINFTVVSNKGRSSCRSMISPAGEAQVAVTLKVGANGQLICP